MKARILLLFITVFSFSIKAQNTINNLKVNDSFTNECYDVSTSFTFVITSTGDSVLGIPGFYAYDSIAKKIYGIFLDRNLTASLSFQDFSVPTKDEWSHQSFLGQCRMVHTINNTTPLHGFVVDDYMGNYVFGQGYNGTDFQVKDNTNQPYVTFKDNNVGIGINPPSTKLHISGGYVRVDQLSSGGTRLLTLNSNNELSEIKCGRGLFIDNDTISSNSFINDIQPTVSTPPSIVGITITANRTIVDLFDIGNDLTINSTIGENIGDELIVILKNDNTYASLITWGINILAEFPNIQLIQNKTNICKLIWSGSHWMLTEISPPL